LAEYLSGELLMTTAETETYEETELIEAWRAEALERAGYGAAAAAEIAVRHDIDLHKATDLVERGGCPADLALRILL
jgi:hypothetical protein